MTRLLVTRFGRAYGLRHPIASAGMAFVGSTSDLAVAVGRAGGLGAIGAGALPPEAIAAGVAAFRAGVTAPLNVNFVTPLATDAHIDACVRACPEVVSFHWGHPPRRWVDRLHGRGIKVWEQVGSAQAATRALDDGIDLLVVQGSEAGGHNLADLPTFAAIPEVRRAVGPAPLLLAAGGICSGATLAAALALGADGAWLGSRLVASEEANAHPGYKRAIVAATGGETRMTSMFGRSMPDFNPMRVIANRVVREWEGREAEMPAEDALRCVGVTTIGGVEVPLAQFTSFPPTRETRGDLDDMALLAGQGIGQIDAVQPVGQILDTMVAEAERVISALGRAIGG